MTFRIWNGKPSVWSKSWNSSLLKYVLKRTLEIQGTIIISDLMHRVLSRYRFVKAGTLCKLVEALASADTGEIESTYVNVFLATYRTFASPKQVLNLLIER